MKSFLEYIFEDKEEKVTADPHEIMTACLCLLSKESLDNIKQLDQKKMDELLQKIDEIARSNKLIGKSDKELDAIKTYENKYDALCQAISAAKEIIKHTNYNVNYVVLTGRKWHSDIDKFAGIENLKKLGINSYGMKDFNSSDIVLTDKSAMQQEDEGQQKFNCLGVSLKKKGSAEKAADPTMLNRSIFDALSYDEEVTAQIQNAFNLFYCKIIKDNINKFVESDEVMNTLLKKKQYKTFLNSKNPVEDLRKDFISKSKSLKQDEWKNFLSSNIGLMCTHNNREVIRAVINKALGSSNSALNELLKIISKKSAKLANDLISIIYKGDLKALIKNNFDFGLCIGKGQAKKSKDGYVSDIKDAEYETVTMIEGTLSKLQSEGLKPNIVPSKKQIPFEGRDDEKKYAAKLFLDLVVGEHPIANLEIRYKGEYTSSPQIFAVMSNEFKKLLTTGKW